MEIDLSTLSDNQKKFYVELLAQSNLEFKKENQHFVAQFKVNSHDLAHHQTPILQDKDINSNEKSRITRKGGAGVRKESKKVEPSQPPQLSKPMNKKHLSKVVKLG